MLIRKDFEAPKLLNFKLKVTELGWFDDEPITSVYLDSIEDASSSNAKNHLLRLERDILNTLDDAIGQYGTELPDDLKLQFEVDPLDGLLAVSVHQLREFAYQLPFMVEKNPDVRRMAFKRSKN